MSSEYRWWEVSPAARKAASRRAVDTNKRKAAYLALRQGPKIHALRVAGLTWASISASLVISVATAQRRYDYWLNHRPEVAKVSITDTKRHVAWTLSRDYTQAKVAEMMKVPLNTVKTWVNRWDAEKDRQYLSSVGGSPLWAQHPDTVVQVAQEAARPSDR